MFPIFSAFFSKWSLLAIKSLVLVGLIGGALWYVNSLYSTINEQQLKLQNKDKIIASKIGQINQLTLNLEQANTATIQALQEIEVRDMLAAERRLEMAAIEHERDHFERQVTKLGQENEQVQNWNDQLVPIGIVQLLKHHARSADSDTGSSSEDEATHATDGRLSLAHYRGSEQSRLNQFDWQAAAIYPTVQL